MKPGPMPYAAWRGNVPLLDGLRPLPRPFGRIDFDGPGGCWLWRAALNSGGSGVVRRGGRLVLAHRFMYELQIGPVPEGDTLDHLCRTRNCVRPQHLEPVPQRVNILRGRSPAARNARARACINGHSYTRANTYQPPGRLHRMCRACRERQRRKREQQKTD